MSRIMSRICFELPDSLYRGGLSTAGRAPGQSEGERGAGSEK